MKENILFNVIILKTTELNQTNNVAYHQHEDATVIPIQLPGETLACQKAFSCFVMV